MAAGVSTFLFAAQERGELPAGHYAATPQAKWRLMGPHADALRRDALNRAAVRLPGPLRGTRSTYESDPLEASHLTCRFLSNEPTGTSAKFDCVLDGGQIIKVKYSRNPEIHAEVAASQLLRALGYAADDVRIVRTVRCYGCPRFPFLTSQLLRLARAPNLLSPHGYDDAYTDFEWVAVERRFDAPPIETEDAAGWAWFELTSSRAPRADLDAFRLLAIFLAHWDNKADNQRLICLDEGPAAPNQPCSKPLLMIQDLGGTFGPTKLNLAGWRNQPVWTDPRQCTVSMRALPWKGATFPAARISEEGRIQIGRQLAALSDDAVRTLFTEARFNDYYSSTDDDRDLDAWTAAFRHRVEQILHAGPCPS